MAIVLLLGVNTFLVLVFLGVLIVRERETTPPTSVKPNDTQCRRLRKRQ